jgi:hypothetical protein
MANNYTKFSECIVLEGSIESRAEQAAFLLEILEGGNKQFNEDMGEDQEEEDPYHYCSYLFKGGEHGVKVYLSDDGEYGHLEVVLEAISQWQIKFGITKPVIFSWSYSCSKPRPGEFGGGACAIYEGNIESIDARSYALQIAGGYL